MINTKTYYILTWQQAPRPPVHPNSMTGKQGFETLELALKFFKKLAKDSLFVNLEKVTTVSEDFSETFIQIGSK